MDNRTKTIGAVLLVLLLAVAAIGYAINYYAEHRGGEVDPDYFVIESLNTTDLKFDTDVEQAGPEYGLPIATSYLTDGQDIVYDVDDSAVKDHYYLVLVDYKLYLDDGTIITGNVDGSGNHTVVDTTKSTVVTSSDLKLYLKTEMADVNSQIRFQLDGTIVSDSAKPVSGGGPAPASAAALVKIDVKVGIIEYTDATVPVVTIDVMTPELVTAELVPGETAQLTYAIAINGVPQYGYMPAWSVSEGSAPYISVSDDGLVTALDAAAQLNMVIGEFFYISPLVKTVYDNANVTVSSIIIRNTEQAESVITNDQQIRIAIGGDTDYWDTSGTSPAWVQTIYAQYSVHTTGTLTVNWSVDNTSEFGFYNRTQTDPYSPTATGDVVTIGVQPGQTPGSVGKVTVSIQDDEGRYYYAYLYVLAVDAGLNIVESSFKVASDADNHGVHTLILDKQLFGKEIAWYLTNGAANDVAFSDDGKIFTKQVLATTADVVPDGAFKSTSSVIFVKGLEGSTDTIRAQYTVNNSINFDTVGVTVYDPNIVMQYTHYVQNSSETLPFPSTFSMPSGDWETITIMPNAQRPEVAVRWTSSNPAAITMDNGFITAAKDGVSTLTASMVIDGALFTASSVGTVFTPVVNILDSESKDLNTWRPLVTDPKDGVQVTVKKVAVPVPVDLPTDLLQEHTIVFTTALGAPVSVTPSGTAYNLKAAAQTASPFAVTAYWQAKFAAAEYAAYTDDLYVTVKTPTVSISVNDFLLGGGQSRTVSATSNASEGSQESTVQYTWTVSPTSSGIVYLTDKGKLSVLVTALESSDVYKQNPGSVTLTILMYYGPQTGGVYSESSVIVTVPIALKAAGDVTKIAAGEKLQMTALTGIYEVSKWESSDVSVATVDSAGLVTGVGGGEVDIRATVMVGRVPCTAVYHLEVDSVSVENMTETFENLSDALAASGLPENAKISLLGNTAVNASTANGGVFSTKNVTIDAKGHTITFNGELWTLTSGKKVTISNAIIKTSGSDSLFNITGSMDSGTELNFNNCTFELSSTNIAMNAITATSFAGTMTFDGCTFDMTGNNVNRAVRVVYSQNTGLVTVKNCVFKGIGDDKSTPVKVSGSGVTEGTFKLEGTGNMQYDDSGSLKAMVIGHASFGNDAQALYIPTS